MRGEYFQHLPLVDYNNRRMRNLLVRAALSTDVLTRTSSYYPYIVKDGETPVTIAHDYYGSVAFDWVVLLSNQIIDPYFEWPLSSNDLAEVVAKKYGSLQAAQQLILHYRKDGKEYPYMTTTTYKYSSPEERMGWQPVYAYDWEVEQNEKRRKIRLVSNVYLPVLERQVQTVFAQPRRAQRIQRAKPETV